MAIWNLPISVLGKTLLRWIFPPMCIHCDDPLDQNRYFCQCCLESINNCFIYREDMQLCRQLYGKSLCIAFESIGPLYTLSREDHPTHKKIFNEFVQLAYLQSNVFGCDGIVYCDKGMNFRSVAYIAKKLGRALSLPIYKIHQIQGKLYLPLLLCWQTPNEKEIERLRKRFLERSISNMNILILFDRFS